MDEFLPHMEEEENTFQPLLCKYFNFEELKLIKVVMCFQFGSFFGLFLPIFLSKFVILNIFLSLSFSNFEPGKKTIQNYQTTSINYIDVNSTVPTVALQKSSLIGGRQFSDIL